MEIFIYNLLSLICTHIACFIPSCVRLYTKMVCYGLMFLSSVLDWIKSHGLSYLAVPKFIASGSHDHAGTKFRFMVMERFGEDIEKKFCAAGRRFSLPTVCYLALKLVRKKNRRKTLMHNFRKWKFNIMTACGNSRGRLQF